MPDPDKQTEDAEPEPSRLEEEEQRTRQDYAVKLREIIRKLHQRRLQ